MRTIFVVAAVMALVGGIAGPAVARQAPGLSPLDTTPPVANAYDQHPSIAVDTGGYVHIAFTRTSGAMQGLYYITNRNGPWTAVRLTTSPLDEFPQIHVDGAGKVHIVWWKYQSAGGNTGLFEYTNASGTWQRTTLLASATINNGFASGLDGAGKLHVIANTMVGAGPAFRYITNMSGTFVSQTMFTAVNNSLPDLAITSTGKVDFVFEGQRNGATQSKLWYATNASGSWPAPAELPAAATGEDPTIDLTADDHVHIAYTVPIFDNPPGVYHMTNLSGSWVEERLINSFDTRNQIAVESDGDFDIVAQRDTTFNVHKEIFNHVSGMTKVETPLVSDPAEKGPPSMALDSNDRAHIVFATSLSGRSAIEYLAPNAGPGWTVAIDDSTYLDTAGPAKADIAWLIAAGITSGCAPNFYCPTANIRRDEMASFLARALGLTGTAPNAFSDDNGNVHEPNINLVAQAGITSGCGGGHYCPAATVRRDEMASFLARAVHLTGTAPNAFTDDAGNPHEPNINLVAQAGITTGCAAGMYCPANLVTRAQMASFLHRAFGP